MSGSVQAGSEKLDCVECGHAVTMHTDNGCVYRTAGTREHAPRLCTCERTRIELRRNPNLTRPR